MKNSPLFAVYGVVIDFVKVHDYEVFNYYANMEIPIICNMEIPISWILIMNEPHKC